MKFSEIERILNDSNPKDWLFSNDDGIYTYKEDVRLNIATKHVDGPDSGKKLNEEWVNKYPNKDATLIIAKVYYSGAFVKPYLHAAVDGGKTIIPLPKSAHELEISRFQRNLGKILDYRNNERGLKDYDARLQLSGMFYISRI